MPYTPYKIKQWILIVFISFLMSIVAQKCFAQPGNYSQSSIPGWALKGNNITNSGINWLGTKNQKSLSIRTFSIEAIHVDSTQRVGIGMRPDAKLDILAAQNQQSYRIVRMRDSLQNDLFSFRGNGDVFYKLDRVIRLLDTGRFMNILFGANTAPLGAIGNGNIMMGDNIVAPSNMGNYNTIIGSLSTMGTGCSGNRFLAVNMGNNVNNSIGMSAAFSSNITCSAGFNSSINASNIISFGGYSSAFYNSMHMGRGVETMPDSLSPFTLAITTLQPDSLRPNISADTANFILRAAAGSGTGIGGSITFRVAPAGSAGWFLNPWVNAYRVRGDGGGNIQWKNKVPTTTPASTYTQYADTASAGNTAAHFRTELGQIIKLYTQSAITNPTGGSTTDSEARTAIIAILTVLRNAGLIEP